MPEKGGEGGGRELTELWNTNKRIKNLNKKQQQKKKKKKKAPTLETEEIASFLDFLLFVKNKNKQTNKQTKTKN